MARKSSLDRSVVRRALDGLKRAKTVDELRRAQAVALPDRFGVDLDTTGAMIGKSRTSVARLRREFLGLTRGEEPVSYTHLRAHETRHDLVCRLLLEKKKERQTQRT